MCMASKFTELKRKLKLGKEEVFDTVEASEEVKAMPVDELLGLLDDAMPAEKPEQVSVEDVSAVNTAPAKEEKSFPVAINVYYNAARKKFVRVVIEYDLATNYSRIIQTEDIGDSSAVAMYKINGYFAMKLTKRERE